MFYLYGYGSHPQLIDHSDNELYIINKLGECMDEENFFYYSIVLRLPEQDIAYKLIYSQMDYIEYVEEYRANNKQKVLRK